MEKLTETVYSEHEIMSGGAVLPGTNSPFSFGSGSVTSMVSASTTLKE
jgi:hypothetical protein